MLLIAGLMLAMLFLPVASFTGDGVGYTFNAKGIFSLSDMGNAVSCTWPVSISGAAALVLSLCAIFLYKNRPLQIKIVGIAVSMILIQLAAIAFYGFTFQSQAPGFQFEIALSFPLIAIVLGVLTISAVRKDENLVKSLDRLR